MTKLKSLPLFALCALLFCALCSCSGYDSKKAEKLIDKYEDKGRLNREEYAEAVDMCSFAMEDALKEFRSLAEKSEKMNADEFEEASAETADRLNDKFEYMEELSTILYNATKEQMGSETYDKWQKANDRFNSEADRIYNQAQKKLNN